MLPVYCLIGVVMLLLSAGSQPLLQETRHSSQNATLTPTPGHHPCFSTTASLTTGRISLNSTSTVLGHLWSLKYFVSASIFFWHVEVAGGLRLIESTTGKNDHFAPSYFQILQKVYFILMWTFWIDWNGFGFGSSSAAAAAQWKRSEFVQSVSDGSQINPYQDKLTLH